MVTDATQVPADQTVDGYDPYEDAEKAEYTPNTTIFGHCSLIAKGVVWPGGGAPRVDFDPNIHARDARMTGVDIDITPIPGTGQQYPMSRSMIAQSKEWAAIVKPSLVNIKMTPQAIDGQYVQAHLVKTGRTYPKKDQYKQPVFKEDGSPEMVEATTIVFDAVYPDEESCFEAWRAAFGSGRGGQSAQQGLPTTQPSANGSGDDSERETALKFLPALWVGSGHDKAAFLKMVGETPMVARHFDEKSPEVQAIIG